MTARERRRALPALAASLRWYKRDVVRGLERLVREVRLPSLRLAYANRLRRVRAMTPAAFRSEYISLRASQLCLADLQDACASCGRRLRILRAS